MKRILFALLFLVSAFCGLTAGDIPRTLPAEFYTKNAKKGTRHDHVWKSAAYDAKKGLNWDGTLAWKADDRVGAFSVAVKDGLKDLATPSSDQTMVVSVLVAKLGFFGNSYDFRIEVAIKDASGAIVAALYWDQMSAVGNQLDVLARGSADDFLSAVSKDLLK